MSKIDVVNEIHKNVRVNFPRRSVILKDIDDLWQADLIDMQAMSRVNAGYKYILVVIDCFSKYGWAIPLKQKNKQVVSEVFNNLLKNGRVPKNLQTDLGKEFYNELFKKLTSKHRINHYSTYSTKKSSIVERFIRTIKNKLYKEFSLKGNYKWMDGTLIKKIHEYNHTFHRTIKQTPASINNTNKHDILKIYHENFKPLKHISCKRLQVGDYVRISKYKGCFEKGFTPNWSTEIFKITKVQKTIPFTYLLHDSHQQPILGAFYREELQKTNHPGIYLIEKILKRRGNKLYVKWLGLPSNENSWIDKKNIL